MEILLPPGEKIKLAREFKVSSVTVWKALTGRTNSQIARVLRKAAIERGGTVYKGMIDQNGDIIDNSQSI